MSPVARGAVAGFCGLLFGVGLVLSGMASPQKVLAFLTIGPGWDPTLMVVMASALAVSLPGFWWVRRRGRPFLATQLAEPPSQRIDVPLVAGAALFGLGWGLVGYCPGPAVVAAGFGQQSALLLVGVMLLSATALQWLRR